jgi:hypothetical protein
MQCKTQVAPKLSPGNDDIGSVAEKKPPVRQGKLMEKGARHHASKMSWQPPAMTGGHYDHREELLSTNFS